MRKLIFASVVGFSAVAASVTAHAMPVFSAVAPDSGIVQVEGGCGPGGHRGPNGRCYPNYGRGYGRPIFRGCPPGMHLGRFGHCRPNF